ncbi:enoyl-CoA hydratase/isomerase family protein [Rugamonas aquatica]|uniref:3-hydroxyisobutyryl-CoA hydrolase n=1 Tax=Rugamonas aquatica TaxID=2743357 RepID=A0A6A7MV60_9BURK|nr:enoyl-CoA hydratase/isomerase family protein [Rugamonas aquatica]MQA37007.1 enoyl-CoA hydratase/isomerase family protein [Rugamonas aquatica]
MRESANQDYAPAVLVETREAVGIITLNAPGSLHALTLNMIRMVYQALQDWAANDAIACVVLQSSTDKAFCAGGDVRTLRNAILAEPSAMPNLLAQSFFSEEYRLDHLIHTYPKPVVVWGGGIVMGGGLGLLAGASHRVVTPTTRIAMPEITIGLFPDVGGSWFLPRMPGRSGLFLGLTGAALNAHDALFTGLGDYFLPQEQREASIAALAAAEWQGDAGAVVDRVLRSLSLATDALPVSEVRQNWDTINTLTAGRELGEVVAAITAYQGDVVWLQRAAASLAKGAPSSAALVWELQKRSRHLSLADVFRMELVVALQCCAHPDFPEGVRALLVDKDNAPQWSPRTLDAAIAAVDEFFQAPGPQHPLADLN